MSVGPHDLCESHDLTESERMALVGQLAVILCNADPELPVVTAARLAAALVTEGVHLP